MAKWQPFLSLIKVKQAWQERGKYPLQVTANDNTVASILLKLRWKQNNLLHSEWQISLKNKENWLFLLCMNLEKIKIDDHFYFSKNINYTWLKRGTFKLSQVQNDVLIRYLVPEIERLEYESLSKVVYQTTVLLSCFEQVIWMNS